MSRHYYGVAARPLGPQAHLSVIKMEERVEQVETMKAPQVEMNKKPSKYTGLVAAIAA